MTKRPSWIHRTAPLAALTALACLILGTTALPAFAAPPDPRPLEQVVAEIETLEGDSPQGWQIWDIQRRGFKKKVSFARRDADQAITMKYKGIPVSWGGPLELVVDPDKYARKKHRVKYRFEHPTSGRGLVMAARSKVHRVRSIPIRDESAAPLVELLDADSRQVLGSLRFHWDSARIFDGEIGGRSLVIERLGEKLPIERGLSGYFLTPYPIVGEFLVRVDGEPLAIFTQQLQRGSRTYFELALRQSEGGEVDADAMTAFIVFDLMKGFVEGIG